MKGRLVLAVAAVGSLAVAGCSSSSSSSAAGGGTSSASAATKSCVASVGFEGPITGPVAPLGTEQLHFAQLAVLTDNLANKTKIKLVQGDTQLQPAQATTVSRPISAITLRINGEDVEIAGHVVPVSNPDKIFFPQAGYTKRDLVSYYLALTSLLVGWNEAGLHAAMMLPAEPCPLLIRRFLWWRGRATPARCGRAGRASMGRKSPPGAGLWRRFC